MIDAIVAGHLCIDLVPDISAEVSRSEGYLRPGRLSQVGPALICPGGAVSNTGIALHRLGLDVRLVGRLGDDLIGDLTRQVLRAEHPSLAQSLVLARGEASGYTLVFDPPGVDRCFLHCPGTNDTFGSEDVPDALLAQARLLHFGYPPVMQRIYASCGQALHDLMARARSFRVTTSLDMCLPDPASEGGRAPWDRILARVLPLVDVFVPSLEELLYMFQRERYEVLLASDPGGSLIDAVTPREVADLAQRALDLGAAVVALKLGHRGLYLRTAEHLMRPGQAMAGISARWEGRELWAPCYRVPVRGTVGAGDATIAGLLAAILRGQGPDAAIATAVSVGASKVEAPGASRGVCGWDESQARIGRGAPRLPACVEGAGWRLDPEGELWRGPGDRCHGSGDRCHGVSD